MCGGGGGGEGGGISVILHVISIYWGRQGKVFSPKTFSSPKNGCFKSVHPSIHCLHHILKLLPVMQFPPQIENPTCR